MELLDSFQFLLLLGKIVDFDFKQVVEEHLLNLTPQLPLRTSPGNEASVWFCKTVNRGEPVINTINHFANRDLA